MRYRSALNYRRTPSVESLEHRSLLSGLSATATVVAPPAIVSKPPSTHTTTVEDEPPNSPAAIEEVQQAEDDGSSIAAPVSGDFLLLSESSNQSTGIYTPIAMSNGLQLGVFSDLSGTQVTPVPSFRVTSPLVPLTLGADRPAGTLAFGEFASTHSQAGAKSTASADESEELRATMPHSDRSTMRRDEIPAPRGAGLIADVLPFDRKSLERAINRFFDRFHDLGTERGGWLGTSARILPVLAVATAVTALDATLRRLRRSADDDKPGPEGVVELLGFPELPGPWSTRIS